MAVKGLMSLLAEGMSVENLKRIGMLTDESAKKPRSVKLAQDKYKTFYENNDQFRAREEGSILNPQIVQRGLLDDRRIIMPEDIENTVLVPHKGDISGTDVTLTNIGGFELPVPVTSRGGARYPNSPLTPEGNYWASMKTGAAPFQNKAEGLMQALDMDATGVYTAMGREANYFNQAFADGMLQWAQSMKLPKEMVKKFDDDLRKSKPEWVGLDSPEARDQLLGIGNFKPEGAGKFRSAFTKKMSKAEYRDLGFPTITDIEKAFIDPDLAGTALGEAGFTMGRVGKGFDLNRNTNHPSYDTGIGGEYIGGFEQNVPPQIMYPDAYKKLEGVMTKPKSDKPPRLLYDAEKVDAIAKRKDLFQIADARWVDTVSKWLEENKGASLQAAIMAVGIPAALAPQEAEAGAAGLLSGGLGTEQAQAAEYNAAPVVQEQSFGDMVNEYAQINQRAQAAEAQKFDTLMREDARLRAMGSAAFGQVSPELAAYRRSQILPTIGEIGMGALEGAVDTVDFVSQLPTAISTMTMPKRTPLRDRLSGLLDYSFVDERDQRARDEARLIGGLLSPI